VSDHTWTEEPWLMPDAEPGEVWIRGTRTDGDFSTSAVFLQGCSYCDDERANHTTFFPPHRARRRCESGKRPHCTCDTCF